MLCPARSRPGLGRPAPRSMWSAAARRRCLPSGLARTCCNHHLRSSACASHGARESPLAPPSRRTPHRPCASPPPACLPAKNPQAWRP